MTEYEEKIGTCKRAEFVFNKESSFALYLEFSFDKDHLTGFYITSYSEVEQIRKLLNKNKTGMAQDSLDNKELEKLVGKTAKIKTGGIGSKCYYEGFLEEMITK